MSQTSYLPNLKTRLVETWNIIRHIMSPPTFAWPLRSTLVILDPIEAYASLFDATTIDNIQRLIDGAEHLEIPIIVTRWQRTLPSTTGDADPGDAIDPKGHWTFYVPVGQSNILPTLRIPESAQIIDVRHTNAFMSDAFAPEECSRLIIAGSWMESCVINTARAGLDRNHPVTVVKNACAGHSPGYWTALYALQLAYGSVVNV